jgi:phytanoyl-CoA hydroxylase
MSAESLLPWYGAEQGMYFASDHRDIVMVAGRDPYHRKGIEDRMVAHVRPSGEGDCGNIDCNLKTLQSKNMVLLEDDHDQ